MSEPTIEVVITKAAALKKQIDKAEEAVEKLKGKYSPLAERILGEAEKVANPTDTGGRKAQLAGASVTFPAASLKLTGENYAAAEKLVGGAKFAKLAELLDCPFKFVKGAREIAKALLSPEKFTGLLELVEKANAPRISFA